MVEQATRSLLAQDYPELALIAVDDRSTDGTGAILDAIAAEDTRLKVLHIEELPAGWLGKTHALHAAAATSSADWLLFTDADVLFVPDTLRRAIALAEAGVDRPSYCRARRPDRDGRRTALPRDVPADVQRLRPASQGERFPEQGLGRRRGVQPGPRRVVPGDWRFPSPGALGGRGHAARPGPEIRRIPWRDRPGQGAGLGALAGRAGRNDPGPGEELLRRRRVPAVDRGGRRFRHHRPRHGPPRGGIRGPLVDARGLRAGGRGDRLDSRP